MPQKPLVLTQFGSLNTRLTPERVDYPQLVRAKNIRFHGDEIRVRPGQNYLIYDPYFFPPTSKLRGIGAFKDNRDGYVLLAINSDGNLFATNPYTSEPDILVGSTISNQAGTQAITRVLVDTDNARLMLEDILSPIPAGVYMDTAAAYGRSFMVFSDNLSRTGVGGRQMYFADGVLPARFARLGIGTADVTITGSNMSVGYAGVGDVETGRRWVVVLFATETGYISGYTLQSLSVGETNTPGQRLQLTDIPLGPASNVRRRIIGITPVGGTSDGPFYYIPEGAFVDGLNGAVDAFGHNVTATVIEDNSTTTGTFNFTDEFLLASVDVSGYSDKMNMDNLNAKSIFYSKTQRRLVTCGEDSDTWRLSEVDDPETFMLTTGLVKTGEGDAGETMCAREFRRELYLLKNNGGYLAQGTALTPAEWAVPQMWSDVGPEGPWAAESCDEFLAFAHKSGPYIYRGSQPEWLGWGITGNASNEINWDRINWAYKHLIYVTIDAAEKIIKFGVPHGDSTVVNIEFIADYSNGWSKLKWSHDDVISARTIVGRSPGAEHTQLFSASNRDGKILVESLHDPVSATLDGTVFEQRVRTAYVPGGSSSAIYQLTHLKIKAAGEGNARILLWASETANPIEVLVPLSNSVRTITRGLTGAQSEQWSVEVLNADGPGNQFQLLEITLYMNRIYNMRTPE